MTIGKQCLAGTSQPRCIMKYPPQRLLCATKSNNTNSTGAILQTKRHRWFLPHPTIYSRSTWKSLRCEDCYAERWFASPLIISIQSSNSQNKWATTHCPINLNINCLVSMPSRRGFKTRPVLMEEISMLLWSDHWTKRGSIFRNVELAAKFRGNFWPFHIRISKAPSHPCKIDIDDYYCIDPTSATDAPSFPFVQTIADALDTEQTLACSSMSGDARVGLWRKSNNSAWNVLVSLLTRACTWCCASAEPFRS